MSKSKKKTKAKAPKMSPTQFKIIGAHSPMKVNDKSKKLFYFDAKIDQEKASKAAKADGAEALGVSANDVTAAKPKLKYDFYCTYDAELNLKFLRLRPQELGVNEQVKGVLVGNDVIMPAKSKNIPGNSVRLDLVELFEIKRLDSMTLDGLTGSPAKQIESLLTGTGKKAATPAWVNKNSISTGPYSSIDKVVKAVGKAAATKPSDAKRVIHHELNFKKLNGFYIPTYYVGVSAGKNSKTMKVNAVNGKVSVQV